MSIWNALGGAFIVDMAAIITLPVLLGLVWLAYIKLTPGGRAWNAWWEGELARLQGHAPRKRYERTYRKPSRGKRYHPGHLYRAVPARVGARSMSGAGLAHSRLGSRANRESNLDFLPYLDH